MKTLRQMLVLAVAALLMASAVMAEDKAAMSEEEMMKAYMALVAPGEPHALLARAAGEWTFVQRFFQGPDAPPQESPGTCSAKMIMDGRYLLEEIKSEVMGMPFNGHSLMGYDNFRKEYRMVWVDNMSTGMMLGTGQYDAATKTLTMNGTMDDVMANKKDIPYRCVTRETDNDHHTFEMWGPGPDGKDMKVMEIVYTRAK